MDLSPVIGEDRRIFGLSRSFPIILLVFLAIAGGRILTNIPWCDEGFFFSPVYNWITEGHTGTSVIDTAGTPWVGIEQHMYWQPPLHLLVHGAWLSVFGLNLWAFRACSLVAAMIVLFLYRALLTRFGATPLLRNAALLLIAVDYSFTRGASDGRTDMLASAMGLGSLVAYLNWRDRHFTRALLLSQILTVASGLMHPMGALPPLAMIVYFFIKDGDWRRVRLSSAAVTVLPYLVGAFCWGLYISEDADAFRRIFLGSTLKGRAAGGFNLIAAFKREIVERYLMPNGLSGASLALRIKLLIPLTYLAAPVIAWLLPGVRRMPHMRSVTILWSFYFLIQFFLDNQRNGTYLMHIFPWYAVMLASILFWVWDSRSAPRVLTGAAFAAVLLLHIGGGLYVIKSNPYRNDFLRAAEFVQHNKRSDSFVNAPPEMGFAFGFGSVKEDLSLGYFNHKKADIVIMNVRIRQWMQQQRVDRPPVYEFMKNRLQNDYSLRFETRSYQIYVAN